MEWFILGILLGLIGRHVATNEKTSDTALFESREQKYQTDIAYYKKLTKDLVEENKQVRAELRALKKANSVVSDT